MGTGCARSVKDTCQLLCSERLSSRSTAQGLRRLRDATKAIVTRGCVVQRWHPYLCHYSAVCLLLCHSTA
jgi:hypothetical protein